MPEKKTLERAEQDRRAGKATTTQAGEFIREEMEHIREGKHGARSPKQAIAIGLSKARRSGVKLPPPGEQQASPRTRKRAVRDLEAAKRPRAKRRRSAKRSRATSRALSREGRGAASRGALAQQARQAARRRTKSQRAAAARKAAASRTAAQRSASARKAAATRKARAG